jgi:transcription initiation factor TFIID subunit 1
MNNRRKASKLIILLLKVRLTYILESILNDKLKVMQEAWPFMKPVNRKQMKVYYEMIKVPMDLETVSKKVAKHAYHSR